MKKKLANTVACGVALLLSASIAVAQTDKNKGEPKGKLVKGSEVVGAKLFNQKGDHIGEINDVVFDENSGGMTHAIVSVGGWLGIGDKETAVPWKFVQQSKKDTPGYVIEIDQAKLRDTGDFEKSNRPKFDETWYQKNYAHYGLTAAKNAKLVRASEAMDAKVFDQKGAEMGQIDNLLIHPNSGKVAYATLDIGTYAGKGNQLTNVPWDLVRQSKKDSPGFVVNAEKAKLQGGTYFDRSHWPDYGEMGWQTNTYSYYGFEPYWTHPMIY